MLQTNAKPDNAFGKHCPPYISPHLPISPISPSPYLPISLSPHLPISPGHKANR
ncbi:hypothetical protein [Moorena sp. SIO2C4]|uniref:hypothetical protein n=1 Tax=Moorena sp. SIO2C4 TaxID=2607824 RepID=UPI00257A31E0|nr:hypothetical protein [Moorena sp. SIO2C4]